MMRYGDYMSAGLADAMPMHPADLPAQQPDGSVDWSCQQWGGVAPDLLRAMKAMEGMHKDEYAPAAIRESIMWILDGTGTSIFRPTDPDRKAKMYCYWKKEDQIRWYIAVDACGYIDFVSPIYNGKLDDATALLQTGFYEYGTRASCILQY